jgi:hypothetical protein
MTPTRLDIRHLRNHALKAISTRRLGVSPEYCLLGIARDDAGAVIIHVNSGGNMCAVEQHLNGHGYRAEFLPFDGYGEKVRVTLRNPATANVRQHAAEVLAAGADENYLGI